MPGTPVTRKPYISIINGTFRQKVDKDTPGAIRRDYKTSSGVEGTKYELEYGTWSGVVKSLSTRDTDYGEQFNLEFEDAVLTIGTNHRMFNSLMEKLPNADLTKKITLKPYDFEDDTGRRVSGVNVFQDDQKLGSYYVKKEGDKYVHSNGYPAPDPNAAKSKNYWKKHFMDVQEFLVAEVQKLQEALDGGYAAPARKAADVKDSEIPTKFDDEENQDIKLEDVPF